MDPFEQSDQPVLVPDKGTVREENPAERYHRLKAESIRNENESAAIKPADLSRALARAFKAKDDAWVDPSEPDMKPFAEEVIRLLAVKKKRDQEHRQEDARQAREATGAEPDTIVPVPGFAPGTIASVDKEGNLVPVTASGNYDPKGAAGASKLPMSYIPPLALATTNAVFVGGAVEYTAWNYLNHRMKAMTYIDAIKRHLTQYECGHVMDQKSGLPHMAHIMANASILIEQHASGKIIDDRPGWVDPSDMMPGPYPAPKEES